MFVGQRRPRLQTRPRYSAPTAPFPKCPQRPSFVIPRAVAESISREPTHQPDNPAPSALHRGYCDFAQYDGVGIPRAVAGSISREPTHQPEKPAPSALHHGYCDFAQYDGVGIPRAVAHSSARKTQTSSFRDCARNVDVYAARSLALAARDELPITLNCTHLQKLFTVLV